MIIVTESGSVYDFNLDKQKVTRYRSEGSHLRKDGEPVDLVKIPVAPWVGKPFVFIINLNVEGVAWTVRQTTSVKEIDMLKTYEEFTQSE